MAALPRDVVVRDMVDTMRKILTDFHGASPSDADVIKAIAGSLGWPLADTEEEHEAELDRLLGPKEKAR